MGYFCGVCDCARSGRGVPADRPNDRRRVIGQRACILVFTAIYAAAQNYWATTLERHELTAIVGAIEDAILLYDENFTIIFFNPTAEKLFKLGAGAVMGHQLSPRDVEKEDWRILSQVVFPSLAPRVVAISTENQYPSVAEITFADPELESFA